MSRSDNGVGVSVCVSVCVQYIITGGLDSVTCTLKGSSTSAYSKVKNHLYL